VGLAPPQFLPPLADSIYPPAPASQTKKYEAWILDSRFSMPKSYLLSLVKKVSDTVNPSVNVLAGPNTFEPSVYFVHLRP
jgi:hypothetical protein